MPATAETELRPSEVPVFELYPQQGLVRVLDVVGNVRPTPGTVEASSFIPDWDKMQYRTCMDEDFVLLLRDIIFHIENGIHTDISGLPGTAKSYAGKTVCALLGRQYYRQNYSRDTEVGDTVGKWMPNDHTLSVAFEDILSYPNLDDISREIVETAKAENRRLTIWESRVVSKNLGIPLNDDQKYRWQTGGLAGSMKYGSLYAAEEPNFAPGDVIGRENSATEADADLRVPEHEGEVIRLLKPSELAEYQSTGRLPAKVVARHPDYVYVAFKNPYGIGGGRKEEPADRLSRLQGIVMRNPTEKTYQQFLRFLITGNDPDIVKDGRTYKGRRDVKTEFRDLEQMPNPEIFINWLAKLQADLAKLAEDGNIGAERDIKGGSYVYDRRNIERVLIESRKGKQRLVNVEDLFNSPQPQPGQERTITYNDSWHDLVMEAIHQEYINSTYAEDQVVIKEIIKASGIKDYLGDSINHPTPPAWVSKATQRGLNVAKGSGGTWVLSSLRINEPLHSLDLNQGMLITPDLLEILKDEGYQFKLDADGNVVTETDAEGNTGPVIEREVIRPLDLIYKLAELVENREQIPSYLQPLYEALQDKEWFSQLAHPKKRKVQQVQDDRQEQQPGRVRRNRPSKS